MSKKKLDNPECSVCHGRLVDDPPYPWEVKLAGKTFYACSPKCAFELGTQHGALLRGDDFVPPGWDASLSEVFSTFRDWLVIARAKAPPDDDQLRLALDAMAARAGNLMDVALLAVSARGALQQIAEYATDFSVGPDENVARLQEIAEKALR